ncbi:MAG: UvrD-helicase domain-containing protein [Rhodocyclaceae bacterium]|nr:UvrD-helicase domain-containing protein [Rhodocyclaceae bacterium]
MDTQSRLRALEPASFIVEAPAGAGKTELLTQRILALLARVEEPEEIVALTFTNKAAAEMRNRLMESLERAAAHENPDEHWPPHKRMTFDLARTALDASRQRGWGLLDHPGRLRVTTIDALCASLARQMPVLSRFGGVPRLAEDARGHYEKAARRALAWLDEEGPFSDAVARALTHLDNDAPRLVNLLVAMLARRDQWLRHALRNTADADTEAGLMALVTQDLERVLAVFPTRVQEAVMPLARFAANNLSDDHVLNIFRNWTQPLCAEVEELPRWQALAMLLLTNEDTARKQLNVKLGFPPKVSDLQKQLLMNVIADLSPSDVSLLAKTRRLPDPRYTEEERTTVAALGALLRLVAAELWTVFIEAGEVDFIEVTARAVQALGEPEAPTDLALSLDYRIRHLLIDEFQDTSPTQMELLRRLMAGWSKDDGRTLFLVGDPMQSIYRFRKAEVGLFLSAGESLAPVFPERLSLLLNHRAAPSVVNWVNDVFPQIFPVMDDPASGAIHYRPFAATRSTMRDEGVQVHGRVVSEGEDTACADTLETQTILEVIDAERRANPAAEIAVLVRARRHLEPLMDRIRRERPDLRFSAVDMESLVRRQPVQDLLSLTHALYHRADRVHWLAILRAPWCRLTLYDLHALAGDDFEATIWSLMNDPARDARLSEEGRLRLAHVRTVLTETLQQQGRVSPARWIAQTWFKLGGPDYLSNATELVDCEAFLNLIAHLDETNRFNLTRLNREVAKLYAVPDTSADGRLKFMTLHKSKGLEFDTVILPGLHRKTGNDDRPLMRWEEVLIEGEERLIAAPLKPRANTHGGVTPYDYLTAFERQRAAQEAARVLYVGVTRAIRCLHLVGVATCNARGEIKPPSGSFLDMLWPRVQGDFR